MRTLILLLLLLCANLAFAFSYNDPYGDNFSQNKHNVQVATSSMYNGRITTYPVGATTPQEENTRPTASISTRDFNNSGDVGDPTFSPIGDAVWFLLMCCGAFVALKRKKNN